MSSTNPMRRMLACCLMLLALQAQALESDRQKPLEVNADTTDGTLGDGVTILRGHVEIRQGSLHIRADVAEVDKSGGKVHRVTLKGNPAYLEQEIEDQGLVQAQAQTIEYMVASGIVTLTGAADVKHPQYEISGEQLKYDLNAQHFQGDGGEDGNGRIHIRLDPEVVPQTPDSDTEAGGQSSDAGESSAGPGEES